MNKFSYEARNDKMKINVWNREYEFSGNSVFPSSIKIGNEEILYSPIRLNAVFGERTGEWKNGHIIKTSSDDESVSFSNGAETENIIVNANVVAESDGFIKIDFRIMNHWGLLHNCDNVPHLTGLSIDIPLKKQFAGLMHFWPNCESGVNVSHKVLNSYATPEGKTFLPFKPCLWTGWEYGGLNICCEDDKSFELKDKEKCVVFENNEEFVNVRINLLDDMPYDWRGKTDEWGDNLKVISYTFGIQATPVKEFDNTHIKNWRVWQTNVTDLKEMSEKYGPAKIVRDENSILEKVADCGVTYIHMHERWSAIQNYGLPKDEEYFKNLVDDCHKLNMKVMVYFGYEVSSLYPEFDKNYENYVNKNINGNTVGGWQRYPIQRDYTVCYKGGYGDVVAERAANAMDKYGVDGIYTDGFCIPWECANASHGCGYTDRDGVLHATYPIFAVRENAKKLYKEVKKRGGIHDTHQSAMLLMPTLSFADSYYDGENLQSMMIENIANLKLDTFRAEFMGTNVGLPCNLISYNNGDYTIRRTSGLSFIHNVFPRARTIDEVEFMSKVWKVIDDFRLEKAVWHPYWKQVEVKSSDEHCYASYYETQNGIVIAAVNQDKNKTDIELVFDKAYTQLCDLLDGGVYPITDGKVRVPAAAFDLQLYEVN